MAKAAEDRFGSCGELAHAARNAASGTARRADGSPPGHVATIPSTPARPSRGTRRRRDVPRRLRQSPPRQRARPSGTRLTPVRQLLLMVVLVVLAAAASGLAVYFLTGNDDSAATTPDAQGPVIHQLAELVPTPSGTRARTRKPRPGALETAVCLPPEDANTFTPDRVEFSTFVTGAAVQRAYDAERRRHRVAPDQGRCNGVSWGGEGTWLHNPSPPGANRRRADPGSATSTGTTPSSSGRTASSGSRAIRTCSASPSRVTAIIPACTAGGASGTTGLARCWRDGGLGARGRLDGTEGGRRILIADHLTLGRGDDAGLVIDDPEISREHAVIAQTPDGLEIRDLSSLNGTWVNGERIGARHARARRRREDR